MLSDGPSSVRGGTTGGHIKLKAKAFGLQNIVSITLLSLQLEQLGILRHWAPKEESHNEITSQAGT